MKKLVLFAVLALVLVMGTSVWADPGPYDATMTADGYDEDGADPIPTPKNTGLVEDPQVWEAIEYIYVHNGPGTLGSDFDTNAETDVYQVTTPNEYWNDLSPEGEAGNFAVISITARNTNTLGVYQKDHPETLQYIVPPQQDFDFLGDGSQGNPYPGGINPFTGTDFGFALRTVDYTAGTTTVWYSDPLLNSTLSNDYLDHMLAFYLPELVNNDVYIDTNGDGNWDDMVTLTKDTYLLAWEDLPQSGKWFDSDYNDTIFLVTRVAPVPEPMSMLLLGGGLLGLVGLRRKKA